MTINLSREIFSIQKTHTKQRGCRVVVAMKDLIHPE